MKSSVALTTISRSIHRLTVIATRGTIQATQDILMCIITSKCQESPSAILTIPPFNWEMMLLQDFYSKTEMWAKASNLFPCGAVLAHVSVAGGVPVLCSQLQNSTGRYTFSVNFPWDFQLNLYFLWFIAWPSSYFRSKPSLLELCLLQA